MPGVYSRTPDNNNIISSNFFPDTINVVVAQMEDLNLAQLIQMCLENEKFNQKSVSRFSIQSFFQFEARDSFEVDN